MKDIKYWNNLLYDDRPIFSEDYETQLVEIENCELTALSRAMRKQLSADRLRPVYHFTKPWGGINDPNGLCFWNGRWHLFYQALGERIHWGHAVSEDMVRWTDLPFAVYPKNEMHCFSGGTCVDNENHRVIAAYYGYTGYDENGWKVGTMIVTSSDPLLLNWTRVNGDKPPIPDADAPCWKAPDAPAVPGQKPYQVFDTCIWKEEGIYYILEAGYFPDPSTGRRYRQCHLLKCENDDLLHWEYVKEFLDKDIYKEPGDDCACPYFVKIGDKRLLVHFSHRGVPKYLIGDYNSNTQDFRPFIGGRFTSGYGVTVAPTAFTCPDGSVACIFNESEAMRHDGWHGCMSLPRRFTLGGYFGDELIQTPFCDYSSLHYGHIQLKEIALSAGKRYDTELRSDAFEMTVRLDADKIPNTLTVEVLRSDDGAETTKITFMKEQGALYAILPYTRNSVIMIDTTSSSSSEEAAVQPPEVQQVVKSEHDGLKLQIFVDKSIVEVFVNDRQYLAMRAYPVKSGSTGISFTARGSDGVIADVDFYQMRSMWND